MTTASEREAAQRIVERGYFLLRAGRDDEVNVLMARAVRRFPDHAEIRLLYATSLIGQQPDRDVAWEVATAASLDWSNPSVLARAASRMYRFGQPESAGQYLRRALHFAPEDFVFLPELLNLAGKLAALEGREADAEGGLRGAIDAEPANVYFVRDLADFLVERDRVEEARVLVEEALRTVSDRDELRRITDPLFSRR